MNRISTIGVAWVFFLANALCAAGAIVQFDLASPQDQCLVVPGALVHWTIAVSVSGGDNAGLALVSVGLVQDPANPEFFDIQPAGGIPAGMENFSRPEGLSNPGEGGATSGYIGVQRGDPGQMSLVQIGGGQNNTGQPGTTMGTNADVVSGIGQGTAQIIAQGTIIAPATLGTYRFSIANPVTNILDLAAPPPQPPEFWPVSVATAILETSEFTFSVGTPESCLRGDVNGDTLINGFDIQPFVDLLLLSESCLSIICPADMDIDGDVDINDAPLFIDTLLGTPGRSSSDDCNDNGVPDGTDIFGGTSQDCNGNYIPDKCDIADQTSNDLNTNGIPDECEPDCNSNGVPDDKDIADQTSSDVNGNGIPDECETDCNGNGIPDDWDLSQGTSADCNNNVWPDECDEDCNGNGVPDDCDVDPTDPDGDGQVSPDCNGNGWPDVCDLTLGPPLGSLDCNDNGIPDECDLANCQGDPACDDCNNNGIPDGCDIASGISEDLDQNGIPDECETGWGEDAGGGPSDPTVGNASDPDAAWTAFYRWSLSQPWGSDSPHTGSQQFQTDG